MNQILKGDCLELMKDIPDGSIDLILCDLPYGTTACKWDTIIDFELMWKQYNRIIRPCGFIILTASQPFTTKLIFSNIEAFSHQWIWQKEQGANPLLANVMPMKNFEDVVVFYRDYKPYDYEGLNPLRAYSEKLFKSIGKTKKAIFKDLRSQGVCHFMRFGSTQFTMCTEKTYRQLEEVYSIKDLPFYKSYEQLIKEDEEFSLTLPNYPRTYNPQMTQGKKYISGASYIQHTDSYMTGGTVSAERYPTSIIKIPTEKSKKSYHPTQKPVALFEYLIKTYTNEGDLVLDNCAGSGTTAIACLNTKRNYIVMEQDETSYNLILDRIIMHEC